MQTSTREAQRKSLIAQIEAAFGDVRLGNGVSLHQARAMDNYEDDATIGAARALDTEERWQDISDEKLKHLSDTLSFMDAEGFRFHIPRFMMFVLTHEASDEESDVVTAEYAKRFSDMRGNPGDRLELLSSEQREVIRAFADFHARED